LLNCTKAPAKIKTQTDKKPVDFIISNEVKDYGNDPYFIKENKKAKAFIQKNGFPKELLLILKNRMPV
jgi:hypothetical protein